jgi:hypothetical protein
VATIANVATLQSGNNVLDAAINDRKLLRNFKQHFVTASQKLTLRASALLLLQTKSQLFLLVIPKQCQNSSHRVAHLTACCQPTKHPESARWCEATNNTCGALPLVD